MKLKLGCIADDFTGATDLALLLQDAGYKTVQSIGIPDTDTIAEADAVVVALKSRTCAPDIAVQQSLDACDQLHAAGAQQIFFKYCSTFDSTDRGNIGPVAEALMPICGSQFAIACPSFPANGRTVKQGVMSVFGQLLSESPMKHHPLTPMTDSDLVAVLQRQVTCKVGLVDETSIEQGVEATEKAMSQNSANGFALQIVDAVNDDHLRVVGEVVSNHQLVTGGSAIAGAMAHYQVQQNPAAFSGLSNPITMPDGASAILAGSCSEATREQINYAAEFMPSLKLDVNAIIDGADVAGAALQWAKNNLNANGILIYSSADHEERQSLQKKIDHVVLGDRIEGIMSHIAVGLRDIGVARFVVAGGETSGAVVHGLGVKLMHIGKQIDPGVPWTVSGSRNPIALALKSGNFGSPEFFVKALQVAQKTESTNGLT